MEFLERNTAREFSLWNLLQQKLLMWDNEADKIVSHTSSLSSVGEKNPIHICLLYFNILCRSLLYTNWWTRERTLYPKTSDFFFWISSEPVVFFSVVRNESTEEMQTKLAMYELPVLQPPVPAVSSSQHTGWWRGWVLPSKLVQLEVHQ